MSHKLRIKDKDNSFYKNKSDFLVRKFGISSGQVMKFLILTLAALIALPFFIRMYNSYIIGIDYDSSSDHAWWLSECTTALMAGVVLFVAGRQVQMHKDALDATEFLNALFSSALNDGLVFSMIIVQQTNHIFYLDKGSQEVFPEVASIDNCTLDMLLSKHGVADTERNAITEAIRNATRRQIKVDIEGANKVSRPLMISIAPIRRPAGFCLIRGSEGKDFL